jgi:phage shock protein C
MERFHLLSSLSFTPHARKLFLDYFARLETHKSQATKDWQAVLGHLEDVVYASLQRKVQEMKMPQEPVNAETMLDVLSELGEPEVFLKAVADQGGTTPAAAAKFRRLYRTKDDKLIAGVCGGLGEYFRIDPILLRILFVALTFAGGWTVLLYVALWVMLPLKPQPVLSGKEAASAKEQQARPVALLRRIAFWGISIGLFALVYIPLLLILAAVSTTSAVAIFTPVVGDDAFSIALSQLGFPGMVAGGAVSLLFFSLFLLVLAFVSRLHCKKNLWGKNLQAILVVLVIMSIFSILVSGGILINENKAEATLTASKEFSVPQDTPVFRFDKEKLAISDIPIKTFTIQGQQNAKQITVQTILKARGNNINLATGYATEVQTIWPEKDGGYLPRFEKKDKAFRFETAELVVIVPATMSLELNGTPSRHTQLEGNLGESVFVENRHGGLFLQNLQTKMMQIKNEKGFVEGNKLSCAVLKLANKFGSTRLTALQSQQLEITNSQGSVTMQDVTGSLNVSNEQGRVKLKIRDYQAGVENKIANKQGAMLLYFVKDKIPTCKISNVHGHVTDLLPQGVPLQETLFTIQLHSGRLRLAVWNPDRPDGDNVNHENGEHEEHERQQEE